MRALVAIAEPLETYRFRAWRAHDLILKGTQPLVEGGRLALDFLALPATPESFARCLAIEGGYDIVHLVCHGRVGELTFEGRDGEAKGISADKLRMLFTGKPVRLVILTACLSGAMAGADVLSGTATSLLKADVPCVVAMQFSARVGPALAFARDLYQAIGGESPRPIEEAVAAARQVRYFEGSRIDAFQWGVPVLYLQAESGDLFAGVAAEPVPVGDWPRPSAPTVRIPPRDPDFVGRGEKMVAVNRTLRESAVVAILGSPGIGKTAIATELAWYGRERGLYPGGILWVDFVGGGTLEMVLGVFGEGFRQLPPEERRQAILAHLAKERTLLVLDNLERLLTPIKDDCEAERLRQEQERAICRFLREVPLPSNVLITSREEVGVDEQTVRLDKMKADEGFLLFVKKARRAGRALLEDERPLVEEICRTLDGYPLAIELAAPHADRMSLVALRDGLRTRMLELLKAKRRGLPKYLTSVEASLDLSYETLSDDARRLFARLSVFIGGAYQRSVSEVCDVAGWEAAIEELVSKSLVQHRVARWELHPIVREYALAKLEEAGEREEYDRRSADFFLELAQAGKATLTTEDATRGLAIFDAELTNIFGGMDWCEVAEEWEKVTDYAGTLTRYLDVRGMWGECDRRQMEGTEAARKLGNRKWEAMFLHNAGVMHQKWGDYQAARDLYQQSLEIKEELGDKAGIASSIGQLGRLAYLEGDYVTAVRLWAMAYGIFEELGSPERDIVGRWVTKLQEEVGEERFDELVRTAREGNE